LWEGQENYTEGEKVSPILTTDAKLSDVVA